MILAPLLDPAKPLDLVSHKPEYDTLRDAGASLRRDSSFFQRQPRETTRRKGGREEFAMLRVESDTGISDEAAIREFLPPFLARGREVTNDDQLSLKNVAKFDTKLSALK